MRRDARRVAIAALVDALEPPRDVGPRVALDRERARGGAHRDAARLVGEQGGDRVGERGGVVRRRP